MKESEGVLGVLDAELKPILGEPWVTAFMFMINAVRILGRKGVR